MTTTVRWVIIVVAVLLVIGLLIWAGGIAHHRGNEEDKAGARTVTALGH